MDDTNPPEAIMSCPAPQPLQQLPHLPWSHFVRARGHSVIAFNIAICERCRRECEAPNPIVLASPPPHTLQRLYALEEHASRLPELQWSDVSNRALCPACAVAEVH